MGETSDQIERHIQETRNDLGDNFNELEIKVKTAVDWRAQFEERPGTMLALAFGGGIILSALLPSGRRSRSTYDEEWKPAPNRDLTPSMRSATPEGKRNETRQAVEALGGALVGVAVNGVSRFIDSLLPGFEREFSSAKAAKSAYSYRPDSGNIAESPAPPRSSAAIGD